MDMWHVNTCIRIINALMGIHRSLVCSGMDAVVHMGTKMRQGDDTTSYNHTLAYVDNPTGCVVPYLNVFTVVISNGLTVCQRSCTPLERNPGG